MPKLMEMLEAGVHFGHKKERSHPKAKDYIFTLREGIYVIDLEKTLSYLEDALNFLKKEVTLGKTILFVGTKRQAKDLVQKVAENVSMPYVNKRFLGGTLTNFETIRKNLLNLEDLESKIKSPEFASLTKKEKKIITDKQEKLSGTFNGVRSMKKLPDVLFCIDAAKEQLAIAEAIIKEIPIVAISDTDANPEKINYPIPANDDAPKSIEMIMNLVEKTILDAQGAGAAKNENVEKQEENIKAKKTKIKGKPSFAKATEGK